jgi:integrase
MLTDRTIAKALRDAKTNGADVWITDDTKARGVGRLQFRACQTGECLAYFRYTDAEGKQPRLHIGVYDAEGRAGLTLRAARAKAGELSKVYQDGHRDLHAYIEHQQAQERAHIESAKREREQAARKAKSGTVRALFAGYIAHLERKGKSSAQDARNIIRRNVLDAFPHLAEMRAADITHRDASAILAKLIDRGAGRTAAKLRAYGRAAWAAAISAEGDPTVHPDLHGFELTANPWALVPAKALAAFNNARRRALSEPELRAFLRALDKRPGFHSDVIMLHLLTGGQRSAQLLRLRRADVDTAARTILLFDGKGNRKQPRPHLLPLTDRAAAILARLMASNPDSAHVFTAHGKVATRSETISQAVAEISDEMVKAKTAREPFDLRDVRRTCETMLAAMGISRDVRAVLLSHGLGGVQARHYDMHEYADEKRNALEAWDAKLQGIASGKQQTNVLSLDPAYLTRQRSTQA